MREFIIRKNDAGQRLDKFIQKAVPLLPKSMLYKGIRIKRIKVNGKRCESNQFLNENDVVTMYVNDEFFSDEKSDKVFLQTTGGIDVLFEDENILLINKPCGLVVHEDNENTVDTLIHRVQNYLYRNHEYDPDSEASFTPALCNRIDRNTSGIVIVAKTAMALRVMNQKIKDREIKKEYLCLVHGVPKKQHALLTGYLKKDSAQNMVTISDTPKDGYLTIKTEYEVLKTYPNVSLLRVNLLTGRTHQIRAHLSHIGHPIVGDGKYGINKEDRKAGFKYQALCSYRLTFDWTIPSELDYLKGRTFEVPSVWFTEETAISTLS